MTIRELRQLLFAASIENEDITVIGLRRILFEARNPEVEVTRDNLNAMVRADVANRRAMEEYHKRVGE